MLLIFLWIAVTLNVSAANLVDASSLLAAPRLPPRYAPGRAAGAGGERRDVRGRRHERRRGVRGEGLRGRRGRPARRGQRARAAAGARAPRRRAGARRRTPRRRPDVSGDGADRGSVDRQPGQPRPTRPRAGRRSSGRRASWPARWPTCTGAGWCTATSAPPTCASPATARAVLIDFGLAGPPIAGRRRRARHPRLRRARGADRRALRRRRSVRARRDAVRGLERRAAVRAWSAGACSAC